MGEKKVHYYYYDYSWTECVTLDLSRRAISLNTRSGHACKLFPMQARTNEHIYTVVQFPWSCSAHIRPMLVLAAWCKQWESVHCRNQRHNQRCVTLRCKEYIGASEKRICLFHQLNAESCRVLRLLTKAVTVFFYLTFVCVNDFLSFSLLSGPFALVHVHRYGTFTFIFSFFRTFRFFPFSFKN